MYHPTTRVLAVLELLQAHHRMTGAELASRIEVDPRTVRRYIVMLQDLGIPVESIRGRYGGYRLMPGYKLPPLMLTNDEALATTLGLMMARRSGPAIDPPTVESALAKINRVLPLDLRERARAIEASVALAELQTDDRSTSELVATLAEAAQDRHRITLNYQDVAGRETERLFDPYGISYLSHRWYVAGYCHLRQDLRTLRIDRIRKVMVADITFERPGEFDSLEYTTNALATMPGYWEAAITLHIPMGTAQQRVPATYGTLEETECGVILHCTPWNLDWLAAFLVSLECEITIHQPDELRDAMKILARRILRWADDGSVPSGFVDDVAQRFAGDIPPQVIAEEIDNVVADVGR